MFNIMELVLTDNTDTEYSYKFSSGINFLEGRIVQEKLFSTN
ncbi:MAG: hypothetical protein ACI4S3_00290 [Candidatus Gastranaerophilaceae bacterium]